MLTPERIIIFLLIIAIVGIYVGYVAAFLGFSILLNIVLGVVLVYRYKKNTEMIDTTNQFIEYLKQYAENVNHIKNLDMYVGDPDIEKLATDNEAVIEACYNFAEYLNNVDSEEVDEEQDNNDDNDEEEARTK